MIELLVRCEECEDMVPRDEATYAGLVNDGWQVIDLYYCRECAEKRGLAEDEPLPAA